MKPLSHVSRRTFLKISGAAAASTAMLSRIEPVQAKDWVEQMGKAGSKPDPVDEDVQIVRSVCLMCHGGCGLQCKIKGGELIKPDGNPLPPNCYYYFPKTHLP